MDNTVTIKIVRSDAKEFYMNSNGSLWKITELDNWGTLENSINTIDNGVGDGSIVTSTRVAEVDRTIVCKSITPKQNDSLRKQTLSFFNPKYTYAVHLSYMGVTRWCEGHLHKIDLPSENTYRPMTLTVTILCPSPWLKSEEDYGENIAQVASMAGFPYLSSCTEGTPKGHITGRYMYNGAIDVSNDGDIDTYCKAVFTASGTVTNPYLIINTAKVRIIDTLAEKDVITMDFTASPPTIKKNGVNCTGKCDRTSDFDGMILKVGESDISYGADDGSTNLAVNIFYNKLYIGL